MLNKANNTTNNYKKHLLDHVFIKIIPHIVLGVLPANQLAIKLANQTNNSQEQQHSFNGLLSRTT